MLKLKSLSLVNSFQDFFLDLLDKLYIYRLAFISIEQFRKFEFRKLQFRQFEFRQSNFWKCQFRKWQFRKSDLWQFYLYASNVLLKTFKLFWDIWLQTFDVCCYVSLWFFNLFFILSMVIFLLGCKLFL